MNYAGHHVISATTPVVTNSPLAIGFLWTDTSGGTPALKICSSISPVTFVSVGGGTVADVDVTFTDNTTGNASVSAHGFMPKLDGNQYNSMRGDGSWGHEFPRGTITASDPFIWSQTWNNGAVPFSGFEVNITNTASLNASEPFVVKVGGAKSLAVRSIDHALRVGGDILLTGINSANNAFIGAGGTYSGLYTSPNRTLYWGAVDGIATLSQHTAGAGTGIQFQFTAKPTIGSGFGTGAAVTANSTDTAGEIDVGTTPGTTGVINFARTWDAAAPFAIVMNKTSGAILTCVASTTTLTITAPVAWANNDKLVWHVIGTNHT